jgi:hypothetical protein
MKPLHRQKSKCQLKPPGTIRVEPHYRESPFNQGIRPCLTCKNIKELVEDGIIMITTSWDTLIISLGDFTNAVETFNKIIDGENKTKMPTTI